LLKETFLNILAADQLGIVWTNESCFPWHDCCQDKLFSWQPCLFL